MHQALAAVALLALCCAACRTAGKPPLDSRLAEAQKAFDEGKKLQLAGKYAEAMSLAQRALELRKAELGETHPDVASCINLMGNIHLLNGLYAQAEPLLQRALAIRESTLGKNHPDVAASLNNLAVLYVNQGLYARAAPLLERALAIRESTAGKNHPQFADSLSNLAILYHNQGLYARAEPLLRRALAIREATLDKNHPQLADSLANLANLYADQGLYAQAQSLEERALAIREKAFGKDHPLVAMSLHNLGNRYLDQGIYARAEPLYQRALEIQEAALDKNHPDVASSLDSLANLYLVQRLYARAEPLYQRALAIREAALGKHHPDVASSLNNLALLYMEQGLYARAAPLYERALEIQEAALGKSHHNVAHSLDNLATVYKNQGLYARAEPMYQRALAITEAALGKNHPEVAIWLNDLAGLYEAQGLYTQAEPLCERALAVREAALGKSHPEVARSLKHLAQLRLAQKRLAEALPLFERGFTVSEQHLRQEVFGFSEARLTNALNILRADEELLYSLVRAHSEDARVRRLALSSALLRKGRSVEEIADISRIVSRSLDKTDRESFERLRVLRTQQATLSLNGPGSMASADYQQRLVELTAQSDALEADLAQRSAPLRALTALPSSADIVDRVAAALPEDGALIELIAYEDRPLVLEPDKKEAPGSSPLRYLALVLFSDGHTGALDLGPAAPIDDAALRLRDSLARRDAAYRGPAQALDALAFRPLLPLLGKAHRLFLAPDGQLGLVPFEAFHDGRRFRVDAFDFSYLTSGKELLPRPEDIPPARSVVVLADPDFDTPAPPLSQTEGPPALAERSFSVERFFLTLRTAMADQPWVPLPGTRREAEALRRLLPEAQVFLGRDASKERLLHLTAPGILHIATHGFFLEDAATAPQGARGVAASGPLGGEGPAPALPDPLLRSGLVLAGARAPFASSGEAPSRRLDDSLVTALELSGLNLWGTELVVLSACDTGRGDVKLGQGVYGLRRALVVAGAETLVMSLWKVNDETTHSLMESYYRDLLAGKGRATALRQAMLALRRRQPHPHFWAPFVTIGRDTPLRALAPHLR